MLLLGSLIFIPFFGEMMEFGVIVSIGLILFLGCCFLSVQQSRDKFAYPHSEEEAAGQ